MVLSSLLDAKSSMSDGKKKKRWIKAATANSHGQFKAKAEKAGETTREYAKGHAGNSGKTGKQARLAETLMGMRKHKSAKHMRGSMYGSKE